MANQAARFSSFAEFYPFYLSEHSNVTSRRLHFIGTTLAFVLILHTLSTLNFWWLLAAFAVGYGLAWLGHYRYQKNRPATFKHPLYSFYGDWVMWSEILRGKIRF